MSDHDAAVRHLLQVARLAEFREHFGRDQWVTVYQSREAVDENGAVFCALVSKRARDDVLSRTGWELSIGSGTPGFMVGYRGGEEQVKYLRFGRSDGIVPLVIIRDFHGLRPRAIELLEEFRHLLQLAHDPRSGAFVRIDADGNEEEVARVTERQVRVKLRPLREFLAVKGMYLAVFFDAVAYSAHSLEDLGLESNEGAAVTNTDPELLMVHHLVIADGRNLFRENTRSFSRLLGKRLIAPLPRERCGIWPYEHDRRKPHESFIIGVDEQGDAVSYSCDPDGLANYFGANPDAPHFLTPVFFRRDVLRKYYEQPARFSVDDGSVSCAGLWSLRIDNHLADHVVVFLGDLGESLSHAEQHYWKSFNVPPAGKISEVYFRRSFLAEFTDPERADLLFKQEFAAFYGDWERARGWPLFKALDPGDAHLLQALRIPLTEEQPEFDQQVLALTKILVDSINEQALAEEVGPFPDGTKGITKFEIFAHAIGLPDAAQHVTFLRNLQELRSTGVGHRKSLKYRKIAMELGIEEAGRVRTFEVLLESAAALVRALRAPQHPVNPTAEASDAAGEVPTS